MRCALLERRLRGCVRVASVRAWARMAQQGGGQALVELNGAVNLMCRSGVDRPLRLHRWAVCGDCGAAAALRVRPLPHALPAKDPQGEVAGKTAGRRVGCGEINRWNGVAEDPSGLLNVVVSSTNEKWETAENAS